MPMRTSRRMAPTPTATTRGQIVHDRNGTSGPGVTYGVRLKSVMMKNGCSEKVATQGQRVIFEMYEMPFLGWPNCLSLMFSGSGLAGQLMQDQALLAAELGFQRSGAS